VAFDMSNETVKPAETGRVWLIDALRGVAMLLMTVFHALVDIRDFFGFADVRYYEPPLLYIGRSSALLFMFISGISCRFSKNNTKRGVRVLLCGMAITVATYIFVRDLYIRFGILHFLGAAIIIAGLSEKLKIKERYRQIALWVAIPSAVLAGLVFSGMRTDIPFLFVIGIITPSFISYDFYPLFPWMGVFLAGYSIGALVVLNRAKLASIRKSRISSAFCAFGRYSLIYYMLHQPALIAVFFVFDKLFRIALNL